MRAAKAKKRNARPAKSARSKPRGAKTSKPKARRGHDTRAAAASKKPKRKAAKPAAANPARPFRFTAADTVQIRFPGGKKPEAFRIDDMVEATLAALDGQTRIYFQYLLVSGDGTHGDGGERRFWFFDPKPVGADDPVGPSLWEPTKQTTVEGADVVSECSGPFSTRSVTSYDGSGTRHVTRPANGPTLRMQLDLNGKRTVCENLPLTVGKNDVLIVEA